MIPVLSIERMSLAPPNYRSQKLGHLFPLGLLQMSPEGWQRNDCAFHLGLVLFCLDGQVGILGHQTSPLLLVAYASPIEQQGA
jgi:hypothetical protein